MDSLNYNEKIIAFVKFIKSSDVMKIDHLKSRQITVEKQKKWDLIHKYALQIGLTSAKDFRKTKTNIWNPLKKRAQESLSLMRQKKIATFSELDRIVLNSLGLTNTELNALEIQAQPPLNDCRVLVKRERLLNSEIIIPDEDSDLREERTTPEELLRLKKKHLIAETVLNRLKAVKIAKQLNLDLNMVNGDLIMQNDVDL